MTRFIYLFISTSTAPKGLQVTKFHSIILVLLGKTVRISQLIKNHKKRDFLIEILFWMNFTYLQGAQRRG